MTLALKQPRRLHQIHRKQNKASVKRTTARLVQKGTAGGVASKACGGDPARIEGPARHLIKER